MKECVPGPSADNGRISHCNMVVRFQNTLRLRETGTYMDPVGSKRSCQSSVPFLFSNSILSLLLIHQLIFCLYQDFPAYCKGKNWNNYSETWASPVFNILVAYCRYRIVTLSLGFCCCQLFAFLFDLYGQCQQLVGDLLVLRVVVVSLDEQINF